jgi:hypothetical protein
MQTLSQSKAIGNPCFQAGNRPVSNHRIILVLAFTLVASAMLLIPTKPLSQPIATAKAFQGMPSDNQYVNFPIFLETPEMSSTLLLNNTTGDERTVDVTIFNNAGVPFSLPPITLKPLGPTRFRMKDLLQNATGDFSSGNIQVFYYGPAAGVTGQVTVVSEKDRLSFESMMTMAPMFSSTTLHGIVWLPDKRTQANVALTNTSTQEVTVTVKGGHELQAEPDTITLRSRETRVMNLQKFVKPKQGQMAALVSLEHSGLPGDLVTTAFALNHKTGFSSNLHFLDCSTAKSSRLAAAHFKFGQGTTKGNRHPGSRFLAPLVLANVADSPTEARIFVDYTVEGVASRIELKQINLAPRETREIELSKELAKRGVSGVVDDVGLDVIYSGPVGTVIGRLTSFDTSKDYSFDVPVKDPLAGMKRVSGVYPWQLSDDYSTVLHLKNTVDKPVYAIVQLRFEGGTYNLERIKLAPYQTVAVDLKQLQDSQQQDIRAAVLPKEVTSGQLIWYEETVGSLIGRAEVVNVDAGIASSFSCGGPCPCPPNYGSSYLLPGSFTGTVGDNVNYTQSEMRNDPCDNVYGPFDRTFDASWTSSSPSIASVQGPGSIYLAAVGSSTLTAQFEGRYYEPQEACFETIIPAQASGGVQAVVQLSLGTISFTAPTPLVIRPGEAATLSVVVQASPGTPNGTTVTLNVSQDNVSGTVNLVINPSTAVVTFTGGGQNISVPVMFTVNSTQPEGFSPPVTVGGRASLTNPSTGATIVGMPMPKPSSNTFTVQQAPPQAP